MDVSGYNKDTLSAPTQVLELLEEYIKIRGSSAEDLIDQAQPYFKEKYSREKIELFLNSPARLNAEELRQIEEDLLTLGCDLKYQKYLANYNSQYDQFCIVVDRDRQCHGEGELENCLKHCQQYHYNLYISNPCFEFWLLLHLSDVYEEYAQQLPDILQNKKVSQKHTFVSKIVSDKAGHSKSKIKFAKNYLHNIDKAISNARKFAVEPEKIIKNIGCNIGRLIEEMRMPIC